ncbi:MAG: hypothetical protein NTW86_30420, partial [Candidatus Sumerlaeota bacterium]|nr:hypothetical protein [Candidatus Sumerlaeota bacterium]
WAKVSAENGCLHVEIAGNDPYLFAPPFPFEQAETKLLVIRMKCSAAGNGEIFWRPDAPSAVFSAEYHTTFGVAAGGQMVEYSVAPPWQGAVAQFRIDFPGADAATADVEWVRLLDVPGLNQPADAAFFEFAGESVYHWTPVGSQLEGIDKGVLKFRIVAPTPTVGMLRGYGPRQTSGAGAGVERRHVSIDSRANPIFSVRMRAGKSRLASLTWKSDIDPKGQAAAQNFFLEPDDDFHTYNIDLSESPVWNGVLSSFALIVEAEPGAPVELQWIGFGPKPRGAADPRIEYFNTEWSVQFVNDPIPLRCGLRNAGGEAFRNPGLALVGCESLTVDQPEAATKGEIPPGETKEIVWTARCNKETAQVVTVVSDSSQWPLAATTPVVVSRPFPESADRPAKPTVAKREDGLILANDQVRLRFPANPFGLGVASFDRWSEAGSGWEPVGVVPWLGALILEDQNGNGANARRLLYAQKADVAEAKDGAAQLRLAAESEGIKDSSVVFTLAPQSHRIEVEWQLRAARPLSILSFRGPSLHIGEGSFGDKKDAALVPGLEWLVGDERSSSQLDAVAPASDRWVADPYKIAIPLMAVQKGDLTAGILWDALQKWDGEHMTPSAKFYSPEWRAHRASHEMGLFLPSIPDWVNENKEVAFQPYRLEEGKTLRLRQSLFALPSDDVLSAVREWIDRFGLPELPKAARSYEEAIRLCDGRYEEMWDAESKQYINWKRQPMGVPAIADLLLTNAAIERDDAARQALLAQVERGLGAVKESIGRDWFPLGIGSTALDLALRRGHLTQSVAAG